MVALVNEEVTRLFITQYVEEVSYCCERAGETCATINTSYLLSDDLPHFLLPRDRSLTTRWFVTESGRSEVAAWSLLAGWVSWGCSRPPRPHHCPAPTSSQWSASHTLTPTERTSSGKSLMVSKQLQVHDRSLAFFLWEVLVRSTVCMCDEYTNYEKNRFNGEKSAHLVLVNNHET